MEFVHFIFSSFWIWLGFAVLVSIVGNVIINVVKLFSTAILGKNDKDKSKYLNTIDRVNKDND